MTASEQYALGLAEGRRYAEQDRDEGNTGEVTYWLQSFRDDVESATARHTRARALGVLRGYREGIRSEVNGKWGT